MVRIDFYHRGFKNHFRISKLSIILTQLFFVSKLCLKFFVFLCGSVPSQNEKNHFHFISTWLPTFTSLSLRIHFHFTSIWIYFTSLSLHPNFNSLSLHSHCTSTLHSLHFIFTFLALHLYSTFTSRHKNDVKVRWDWSEVKWNWGEN